MAILAGAPDDSASDSNALPIFFDADVLALKAEALGVGPSLRSVPPPPSPLPPDPGRPLPPPPPPSPRGRADAVILATLATTATTATPDGWLPHDVLWARCKEAEVKPRTFQRRVKFLFENKVITGKFVGRRQKVWRLSTSTATSAVDNRIDNNPLLFSPGQVAVDVEKVGPAPLTTAKVLLLRDPLDVLTPHRTKPPLNHKEQHCYDPEAGTALVWQHDPEAHGGGVFATRPIHCGSTYEVHCRSWQHLYRRIGRHDPDNGLFALPGSLFDLIWPRIQQRFDAGVAMHIGLAPYMSGRAGRAIRDRYIRLEHSTGASGLYLPLPIRKASDAKRLHALLGECHRKDEDGQPTGETFFRTAPPDVPHVLVIADRRHLPNIEWITPTPGVFEHLLRRYLRDLPVVHRRLFGDWEFLLEWRTENHGSDVLELRGMPVEEVFARAAQIGREDGYLDGKMPRRKRVSLTKRKRQYLTPFEAKLLAKNHEIPPARNGATIFRELFRPAYESLREEAGKPVRKRKLKPGEPAPVRFDFKPDPVRRAYLRKVLGLPADE